MRNYTILYSENGVNVYGFKGGKVSVQSKEGLKIFENGMDEEIREYVENLIK